MKNFVVAGVIAGAISSGGLAAGAGLAGTLAPTWLTFFVIGEYTHGLLCRSVRLFLSLFSRLASVSVSFFLGASTM